MLTALFVFLVGCLVICVVAYVAKLVMARLGLPEDIRQIAMLIVGLLLLLGLIYLCVGVSRTGQIPW